MRLSDNTIRMGDSMIAQTTAKIIDKTLLASSMWLFTLYDPEIARNAQPGQFIHINVNRLYHPLMRRPISIFSSDETTSFQILFKTVGPGTQILAEKRLGEELDIISPLGNCFPEVKDPDRDVLCVAGGIGIAPIHFLLLQTRRKHRSVKLLFGGKSVDDIIFRAELNYLTDKLVITTEDGSLGLKGLVTDYLADHLGEETDCYVCGPMPMVKAVQEVIRDKPVNCYASLEERMGCGFGACRGCTVKTTDGFKRICTDGPVFDIRELDI